MTTPADHPVDKMQRWQHKVKDKPPDPHREYLDAEFSEEEEERLEKLEIEEYVEEVPAPVYTEEELDGLIQCLKDMTTLSGLTEYHWTMRHNLFITEFFQDPSIPILSIYKLNDIIELEFSFPTIYVRELTFFIRQPYEVFNLETFRENVLFGSVNSKVANYILTFMQNVLTPIFFTIENWPDSVKADFCAQLDVFLFNLTDLTYKMLGLTMIYVPLRTKEFSVERARTDKELVKRLESVMARWNTQIKLALADQEQAAPHELLCFDDEYEFWVYRFENLTSLNYQLSKSTVMLVTDILRATHSTYMRQYLTLKEQIDRDIVESKSNIEYLSLLKDTFEVLQNSTDPPSVAQCLPKIIHLFRTIWLNSPYYNTRERITTLFNTLSNQIVVMCKSFIHLRSLFAGMTRKSMKMLNDCIKLCKDYKELYFKISNAHINRTFHFWELDVSIIFRYIDVFIDRCQDMLDICQAMIDFARLDETVKIASPKFSGTNGEEYERVCQNVEKLFHESLRKIKDNSEKIFAVHDPTWHDNVTIFHNEMRDLEIMIENLICVVFTDINNVQEGIEDLRSFYNYLNRPNLKSQFDTKNTYVWQVFNNDIQQTKQEILNEKEEYSSLTPYFSGRALNLRLKSDHLILMRKMLQEAAWMPYSNLSQNIYHQEDMVIDTIEDAMKELYAKWLHDVGDNPYVWFDRFLMRRSDRYNLLECNIEPRILKLYRECFLWISLNFTLPVHIQVIYDKWETVHFVYESVLAVTLAYNRILEALSLMERDLLRELIRQLDRKINPGLNKLTWNTEYIDEYIEDCFDETINFQEFIDTFKNSNIEIGKLCEKICDNVMIKLRVNYTYRLNMLQKELLHVRDKTFQIIDQKLYKIFLYILEIFDGLKHVISEIRTQWKDYLMKIDRMIEEALRLCLKGSLASMYETLHGTNATGPSAVLLIQAHIIDNKISFVPSLLEIATEIGNISNILLEPFRDILRLVRRFKLRDRRLPFAEIFERDFELLELQQKINNEVNYSFTQVQIYLKTWEPYKDIWEVNKDLYLQRFEKLKPDAASFDMDISKYIDTAISIELQDTMAIVHFIEINADGLKAAIIEHCLIWQQKLTALLLRITNTMIDHVYYYIAESSTNIMKEPTDLVSMQAALHLFDRLKAEIPKEEQEFPKIHEQHQILEKYEVLLTFEFRRKLKDMEPSWAAYLELLDTCKITLAEKKEEFKQILLSDARMYEEDVSSLVHKFKDIGPFTSDWDSKDALAWIANFWKEIATLRERQALLQSQLSVFDINYPDSRELMELEKTVAAIELVWQLTDEWNEAWERYKTGNFWVIEIEEMETTANVLFRKLTKLSRELREKHWEIVDDTRSRVDKFRRTLPLITDLKNPAMRPRHWQQVKDTMNLDFDETSEDFTLDAMAKMQMHKYAEEIAEISNAATMELAIEIGLKHIREVWQTQEISMTPYKDKGIYRLKAVDDLMQILEEHQVQLSSMKTTRFVEAFVEEVDYWERTLSMIGEVLDMVLVVQRQYIYLDNIFSTEDIIKQLPKETDEFNKITVVWIEITSRMAANPLALIAALEPPGLLEVLNKLNDKLEALQQALEQYLETKRRIFPRLYFISNDDILEILAHSKRPDQVQPHIRKLFLNIKSLKLVKSLTAKNIANGMISTDGEYVAFTQGILLEGPVEHWLCDVETAMRVSLREVLKQCWAALRKMPAVRDKWVKEWPGQPGITSSQIQWTNDCTRTLMLCKLADSKKPLRKLRRKQNQALDKYSEAIQSELTVIDRLKIKTIVVIEIHARDVIDKMYRMNCRDVNAFEWLSQLRFYWDKDLDDCVVHQTNTRFLYGYEYLGNSGRLVITPLTDRCYITLTTALHLYRGGSPKGPAGTGKTETVKDLGKALGFNVIVQNCSEGLDFKSIGRLFSGLSQSGAWGCFDEFNRINIEVLSVVAQQILSILNALAQKLTRFIFDGSEIALVHTCGIFITMNPGYAGRTELPDNLKSMFRPMSMMVPDSDMIAEINLFCEGFKNTRVLAKKVFTLYSLAKQQLSKQYHYDFGLRGIVTLTRYAGRKKRLHEKLPDDEIIILSMKDMNVAKLTSDDLPLFLDITTDLFPNVDVPIVDYEEIISYITKEAIKLNLQPIPMLITKVIELHENKNSRHSTMLVGASNTAKSATWNVLQNTMTRMKHDNKPDFNIVHVYPINPKALSLGELYGEYDFATGEWVDGVISSIMRKTCSEETEDEKWILFDGPVDADWIENMNSVMDDNKVLTLINNDRIIMPEQVSLLFEVQDLAVASPATVSRAGMIYNDYKNLGWRPHFDSWLKKFPKRPEFVKEMNQLFETHVNATLEFKRRHCEELVPILELNAVQSLCKLLEILATPQNGVELGDDYDLFAFTCKIWFFFCMIWSLGAAINEESRLRMDNFIREIETSFPIRDTVYEYFVDPRLRTFISWEEKLPHAWKYQPGTPFHKIIVPTVDTLRYDFIVSSLLANGFPVLIVGPVGTGKTSTIQSIFEHLDELKYVVLLVNMSAQTTSNNVQDTIESKLEKRTKGVYIPIGGKTMIAFMDDFNMPMKEMYGSQPPLELIRLWLDYKFWYNREKQTRKYIQKLQLIAAMGPPGGGRNVITDRLLTKFNHINMTFPTEKQIIRIYKTMLNQQLAEFHAELKGISNEVTIASIDLYNHVIQKMLPTPTKMHYLFNLRDISKIFQGLLRSHKDYQYTRHTFLRLWIHECFRVFSDRLIDEKDREWFVTHLNEQLGKHFELTFHSVCPEKRSPLFGSFMNPWDIYEDLQDIAAVRHYMEVQMDEYNVSPGVVRLDLILFRDAIEHICRIVRVISQPHGNLLLVGIGGSGKRSLARIGSYMCEQSIYQIVVTKVYRVAEFREDLKSLYMIVGVENKPTSFLFSDTQVVEEQFLEIVNNMLSIGEVANLYKPDEMEDIKTRLTKEIIKAGKIPTTETVYSFLIERARSNMHLILCMSPIGDAFRNRLRQYPALINCTTIDWFLEWPREALLEVGNKFLMNLNLALTITGETKEDPRLTIGPEAPFQERMRDGIAASFSLIHDTVSQFSRRMIAEMKRYNYVTPVNFIELVIGYQKILAEKRHNLASQANKLRGGLSKIDETRVTVKEMAAELEVTQEQVLQSTRECEEFLVTIVNQRRDADDMQKLAVAKSHRIAEEQRECKRLEEIARADLATVEPALNEAMKALDALSKKDLAEIKSFTRPPPKVEMVMEAVMILKNSEPTWAEAKRQLSDVFFLASLRDFDKDHISDRILRTISKYTTNPEFDPIKVGVVSVAAKSLCMWVIAMEKYGQLYRIVAPKREKLEIALASLKQKELALEQTMQQLKYLQEELEKLQKIYDAKMKEKEDLIRLAEKLQLKLERAAMLVEGLSDERIRWEETVVLLTEAFDWLLGDCLISTGFVSYLGPFVSNYREELIDIWCKDVRSREIPTSPDLDVKDFLGDPSTIRDWNIQGLPSDGFSTENGIIVTWATRWPLVIDPQCQAVKWIKNMEAKNLLKVIDFGQPDFMIVLEQAIQFGYPVLLENIGEILDPGLNPILEKAFIKSGDQLIIKFNEKLISYNEKFRLFMTTKLSNPHYFPEVLTKTTLCNFAIKEQGLEAQLLGIVVRKEKPQLEEQKDHLVITIASNKRVLKELEDRILVLLSEAGETLLDDPDLLNALKTSKATALSIQESLVVTEETEKEIDLARNGYRPCAKRASILFFVLNDMSIIDPMYQFSLDSYNILFMFSIDKSPKTIKLSERIEKLNEYHTLAVYRNTCRGLFEHHKLLFSFHMCVKILDALGKIMPGEYAYLLRGGIVLDREAQPDKPVAWLPDETWDNVTELDKLPGFHGLASSFEQFPRDWHNWYISTEPEGTPLVGEWEEGATEFQKMLFIRSCRPDRISFCITTYIVRNLGRNFVDPPVLDLKAVLDDSVPQAPLIFVLSPGVDPTGILKQLAETQEMTDQFMMLSLGQGQAPIATSMIKLGMQEGFWIFLANCHLSLSWMPDLDKIVETLGTDQTLHPRFRLWLSSSPTPQFPISILQAGIKMTTEPPKGLKANMKRLYSLITETQFEMCQEKSKYKKLLFTLVFFHSILLERKKFRQLGWNVIYSFNDSDFEVCENLLRIYLDEYPVTPWESLKYLIAAVCYGGHVTDDWDRRLLMTYVQQYFTDDVLDIPNYRLSSLATYYVPRDGTLESYHDSIAVLPSVDRPEAFGQHPNADITCLITEARNMFETLLSLQVQTVSIEKAEDKEDKVMQLASDVLSKLPEPIDYESTEKLIGPHKMPLDVVLLQEISRYNILLMATRESLAELQRAITGLVVMSQELEEIFTCIYDGRVPRLWLTAYPSLKPLGAWTRDLINRVEHFSVWARTVHPPLFFWLAAYTFPTGFLTAVLQTAARQWNVSIDTLSWEFTVFSPPDEAAIKEPPQDGVYIRSIYLEGAGWDKNESMLIEPAPMQLICDMPVIYFRPIDFVKRRVKDIYNCPCYYYPERCGYNMHSAFVVAVDLNAGAQGSDFWVKRGTALLLSLAV